MAFGDIGFRLSDPKSVPSNLHFWQYSRARLKEKILATPLNWKVNMPQNVE